MIEIHSHILPNTNDGPPTMSESIQLAQTAVKQGVHTLVVTPRHLDGTNNHPKLDIIKEVIHFSHELEQKGIPLKVLPGQEVRLTWDLAEKIDKDEILPVNENTKYILIELPSNHLPKYAEQVLFELQMKGFTPVIAHPERHAEIVSKPQLVYNLVKKGALVQVAAGSINGRFGKKQAKFTNEMIDANLVHLISSEAYHSKKRPFELHEAFNKVEKTFGKQMHYYFLENSQALIENEPIFADPPERIKNKKIFGFI